MTQLITRHFFVCPSLDSPKTGYDHFAHIFTVKSIIIQLLFTTNSMESQLNMVRLNIQQIHNYFGYLFIYFWLFFSDFVLCIELSGISISGFARQSTRKFILESIARQLRLRSQSRLKLDLLLLLFFFFYLVVGVVCLLFCIRGFLRKIQNLFELVKNRLAWWLSDCLWKDQSSAKPIVAYFCQQNRYQFMQLASPVNSAKRNRENEWLCISLSACRKMSMARKLSRDMKCSSKEILQFMFSLLYPNIFGIYEIITFFCLLRRSTCLIDYCSVNCYRFLSNRLLHALTLGYISQNQIINKSQKKGIEKKCKKFRDLPIDCKVFEVFNL